MNRASRAVNPPRDERLRVLVVDSEAEQREMMGRFLTAWNFAPLAAASAGEALALAGGQGSSIALIVDSGAGASSIDLVRALRTANPDMEAILLVKDDSAGYATEAFRAGVYDRLSLPIDFRQLSQDLNTLREALERRFASAAWETGTGGNTGFGEIVGWSAPMQAVFASIRRFAAEDSPVLITGLTGTGKELAARTLHALSPRSSQPLVVYRCCGVSEEVAAAELFGAPATGASGRTGSHAAQRAANSDGVLESARGGCILLDEIGELTPAVQARLAKVLCQRNGEGTRPPAMGVLASSRLNLADQATRGQFNEKLYRQLCRNLIHLPSLAERPEDIPLLCRHFREKFSQEFGKPIRGFSPAAERALLGYPWPGNVRELENAIGRACLLADQNWIELADLSIAAPAEENCCPEPDGGWVAEAGVDVPPGQGTMRRLGSSNRVGSRPPAGK